MSIYESMAAAEAILRQSAQARGQLLTAAWTMDQMRIRELIGSPAAVTRCSYCAFDNGVRIGRCPSCGAPK